MTISVREREMFPKKYKWMFENMLATSSIVPTHLEVLAAILVMEHEDPVTLVELIKELDEN